ncbi:MAG: DNA gyrase subunit A, partial [Clostridia bacterium]|nr:DNA gyrase subunit A [Clostridia bacterium]
IHEFAEGEYLTMVTKQGIIKRTLLTEYEYQRKGGKIALSLKDDDELVFVTHTYGYPTDLMIATRYGSAVRFTVDDESVRPMGRTATGVRGIKLRGDDYVVGVASVVEGKSLITITENGYGKRTDFDDFRQMKHRGGHGVACHALSDKTGLLSGINIVDDNDDVMIITDAGTMIRTGAADIPTYSRSAGGVRVMRLAEGQKIVNFTKIARQDELEEVVQPSEELSGEETEPTEVVFEEVAEEVIPEEPEEAAEQAEDNQDA